MSRYEAVIGLEVHAQLKTRSKLFCACSTGFGEAPNTNTCPVCAGMPGALPVVNKRAVEFGVKLAQALDCRVKDNSVFARKNYFYPDLPKGYQISQYEHPLAEEGRLEVPVNGDNQEVRIIRIHMEDDAGKSIHGAENTSYVDLNRTGVPLLEIVSGPDIYSPDQAVAYLKALRNILIYLDICQGSMQEGNFRCDANVSVRPRGRPEYGTRTEVKNMNSFRFVHKALSYEIDRQIDLLEDGEEVVQETLLFDEASGETRSMRGKEEAHDYRYFPDPDLVPLTIPERERQKWARELPELPLSRWRRFIRDYALSEELADTLTGDRSLADYFERAAACFDEPRTVANWMTSEMLRELNERDISAAQSPFAPEQLAELLGLVRQEKISTKIAKQIFPEVFAHGLDPESFVQEKGYVQITDESRLEEVVREVLAENPDEVASYKQGKKKLMSFFMGQVMKKTKGQANPKLVDQLLRSGLEG
ncbi:MAG: Asp-tRNA(Asn)/Glu-tRNA(Gln) amidotransferase subunit GatB [Desulfohalobiaceae bacterium]|nr:Asp-tRNA(Asn)/Glu-tRNA(Gln) amidotransferase subunit GatB [Desulfohalobiaceae bacterium]